MATKLTGTKHQSYNVSDKLRNINFAEQHGNCAAEREFGVSESNVRLWRKSKENLEKMSPLKRAIAARQLHARKTIKIRTTGNKKNRVTVVLACAGDGSKLRQMVIFKEETVPKVANKHGVVITTQEKGWMDNEGMKTWVQTVWCA